MFRTITTLERRSPSRAGTGLSSVLEFVFGPVDTICFGVELLRSSLNGCVIFSGLASVNVPLPKFG